MVTAHEPTIVAKLIAILTRIKRVEGAALASPP